MTEVAILLTMLGTWARVAAPMIVDCLGARRGVGVLWISDLPTENAHDQAWGMGGHEKVQEILVPQGRG